MTEQNDGVPEGHIVIRKGGRPPKTARDAAVLLARFWRTKCIGETAKMADEWIVAKFKVHGLTAERHVRMRLAKAQETTFLGDCRFAFNEALVFTENGSIALRSADRALCRDWLSLEQLPDQFDREHCSVAAFGQRPGETAMACIWSSELKVALIARLAPVATAALLTAPNVPEGT
jgi:hypothetical protein